MREYRRMKKGQKIMDGNDAELAEFPGLTERELKAAENLFADYIFYHTEGRGRRVWTSCCHKAGIYLAAGVGAADPVQGVLASRHNEMVCCPFCGRWATLKCIGRIGRGAMLEEYQPVVFLRASEDGQTLWAQGYWARKLYDKDDTDTLSAEPRYMATEVYRFRPGEAVRWGNNYHGWEREENGFGSEPFRRDGLFSPYERYTVIGLDEIGRTFLRYTDAEHTGVWNWRRTDGKTETLMRYLTLAAQHTVQTEMLAKAGLIEILEDWIFNRKKNADILKWSETDPRKAFGLNGGELRRWIAGGGKPEVLRLRRLLQKAGIRTDVAQAEEIAKELGYNLKMLKKIFAAARQWHGQEKAALRYLMRFAGGCHVGGGYRTLDAAARCWLDYLSMAEQRGAELWKKNELLPENLWAAHEYEVELLNQKRALEEQKKAEAERKRWAERAQALKEKYAVEFHGIRVVVPECRQDILEEGKALCHCVGGYAERHLEGTTTILFLRLAVAPKTPWLTMEVHGNKMDQLHGYRNEGIHTAGGRFAPDPRVVYKEWLDTYFAWLKAGSRRKADGTPVLPQAKQKKKKTTAA